MSTKILARIIFIIWAAVIAAFSIRSYSNNDDVFVSVRLTRDGFVMHFIAYFVGVLLCNYSFRWTSIKFILLSSFSVFLYGVILEIVQLYLPYRTFNPRDITANAFGIISFVLIWAIRSHFLKRKRSADCEDLHK